MSEYTEALHEFVQASNQYRAQVEGAHISSLATEARIEKALAVAGDRLETVLRKMMRDEANKVSTELYGYPGMR